ncbi:2055_t:CDS:2 [Dentiscutata erythropus]|uniref:2055_t:CDS:1 n=1 Tax=Dentiscutata erythropus TaxID=1348616 RepID=A0A9N9B4P9_9GLOM|nr:2055_t:CDS:2 [Dentiscutata erythropus]
MDAAIDTIYSDSYPLHCIYHISQNLIRNLKAPLDNKYNNFAKDFFLCRNDLSPAGFEKQWCKLIAIYSNAAKYLNSELYPSKERWAKAYTTKFFTAGISSTSCVESETHAQLSSASAECFPEIDCILKEYLTEKILSQQKHKITQSLYYYTIVENNKLHNDKSTEEGYDTQQIHLTSLLEDIPSDNIIKIYRIQRRHCIHINFVVLLTNYSHLYTCMLLVN